MSKSLIKNVVKLVNESWRPYNAQPVDEVYERLGCAYLKAKSGKVQPYWFVRQDVFLCVGCPKSCSLVRPAGFQLPLPIHYPEGDEPFTLTPQEMVARRHTLNVREAAYCLNVSMRTVWAWVAEGKLVALKEKPVRVRASDVAKMMEDFDE